MLTFGIFLLLTISCLSKNKDKEFTFSIEKTELLKAILPFFIVLGHCSLTYAVFMDFSKTGAFVVSLFFFMSGYGLEKKRLNSTVDNNYIVNRIKSILIPGVIPASIYLSYQLIHR